MATAFCFALVRLFAACASFEVDGIVSALAAFLPIPEDAAAQLTADHRGCATIVAQDAASSATHDGTPV